MQSDIIGAQNNTFPHPNDGIARKEILRWGTFLINPIDFILYFVKLHKR